MSKTLTMKISGLSYGSDYTVEHQNPEISEPLLRLIPNERSVAEKEGLSLSEEEHLSFRIIKGGLTTNISADTLTVTGWFKPDILPSTLINGTISVHISEQGRIRLIQYDNYDPRTIVTAAHLYPSKTWIYITIQRSPAKLSFFVNGVLQGFTTDAPVVRITGIGNDYTALDDIVAVPSILWQRSFLPPQTYL